MSLSFRSAVLNFSKECARNEVMVHKSTRWVKFTVGWIEANHVICDGMAPSPWGNAEPGHPLKLLIQGGRDSQLCPSRQRARVDKTMHRINACLKDTKSHVQVMATKDIA